jgi:hypothetical protein
MTQTMAITQDRGRIQGTLTGRPGDAPLEGTVTGNKLRLTVKRQPQDGDTLVIEHDGTVEEDCIKGKVHGERFGWKHEEGGSSMRTIVLFSVLLGAVSLLPGLNFAQSGSTGVFTVTKALNWSPSESGGSPEPSPVPASAADPSPRGIGAGVRLSSLGVGGEVAVALTRGSNLRGGFNLFSYSRGFSKDGISYAGSLSWRSAEAHYDWYPFGGGIHLSPGLIAYNGNTVSATASVPGGRTLTLNGVQYLSDPANPVSGNGKIDFNKVAPTVMLGLGNLVRRSGRRFAVNFEVGMAYQGGPLATLNLGGGVCSSNGLNCRSIASDPVVQANVAAEQRKINHDISPFKVYPLISLGFGYRLR